MTLRSRRLTKKQKAASSGPGPDSVSGMSPTRVRTRSPSRRPSSAPPSKNPDSRTESDVNKRSEGTPQIAASLSMMMEMMSKMHEKYEQLERRLELQNRMLQEANQARSSLGLGASGAVTASTTSGLLPPSTPGPASGPNSSAPQAGPSIHSGFIPPATPSLSSPGFFGIPPVTPQAASATGSLSQSLTSPSGFLPTSTPGFGRLVGSQPSLPDHAGTQSAFQVILVTV